ncbi:MAG: hypothetical protein ACFB4J_12495 [Elainellaceae cyanobacterium]
MARKPKVLKPDENYTFARYAELPYERTISWQTWAASSLREPLRCRSMQENLRWRI